MLRRMAKDNGTGTRGEVVYTSLRGDIFNARYAAGQRLKFPDLCARYGTSVGVAREALTRLTAERLVAFQPHQGYAVASLSAEELTDLTTARIELESLTFRRSMLMGDDHWESNLVAAHHMLRLQDRQCAEGARDDAWFLAHEEFHAALIGGCGNTRLTTIARDLRAETELYRRWAAPFLHENDRDPAAEHETLVDAAVRRDVDRGIELLREHIAFTTQMLLSKLNTTPSIKGDETSLSPTRA
ncbi:hypothetical protein BK799_31955 [Rhodococcus sp. D-1]|nr:hypothetical protein BK799_31955 [Rhodococcus sp. D-1]